MSESEAAEESQRARAEYEKTKISREIGVALVGGVLFVWAARMFEYYAFWFYWCAGLVGVAAACHIVWILRRLLRAWVPWTVIVFLVGASIAAPVERYRRSAGERGYLVEFLNHWDIDPSHPTTGFYDLSGKKKLRFLGPSIFLRVTNREETPRTILSISIEFKNGWFSWYPVRAKRLASDQVYFGESVTNMIRIDPAAFFEFAMFDKPLAKDRSAKGMFFFYPAELPERPPVMKFRARIKDNFGVQVVPVKLSSADPNAIQMDGLKMRLLDVHTNLSGFELEYRP